MVHSLRPVRLRQLTAVKKVFMQKFEMAKKNNFLNNKTANHQQISRKK